MRIFHGFDTLPHFVHPAVTVGSYDGVHSGHIKLLDTLREAARKAKGESVVLTFEPHPRLTLGRAEGLRLLTTLDEKALLLERQGIDNLIVIPFDKAFSALSPEVFVRDYLVGRVGAQTLVVGFDHHFGRNQGGSYAYLGQHDFGMNILEVGECDIAGQKVSSTAVRKRIEAGEMDRAAQLLSHPYLMIGRVDGEQFTVTEPLKLVPPAGQYAVQVDGRAARLTISSSQNMTLNKTLPAGRAVLTFE